MLKLLETFWVHHEVVTRQIRYNRTNFNSNRGTTQVELISTTLFNVVVDNVVWSWLAMNVEDQKVVQEGLGINVGRCLGVFYAEDVIVRTQEPEWLQNALNVIIGLFHWYGLIVNAAKLRTMTCQPRALWLGVSEEAVVQ